MCRGEHPAAQPGAGKGFVPENNVNPDGPGGTAFMRIRLLVVLATVMPGLPATAAEIILRPACQPAGPVVRLGDVAEIRGTEPKEREALAAVELFPAPLAGQRRVVRVREVCDLLALAGVPIAQHRFSGASEVVVSGPGDEAKSPPRSRPVESPRRGEVVVATTTIAKGALIAASDVRWEPAASPEIEAAGFRSLDEVLGREAARAIPPGAVLQPEFLRTPVLVRRGEVINVYACGPAVRIRTTARAQDDGGVGDSITVESLLNRARFSVRITGPRQAEVELATAARQP